MAVAQLGHDLAKHPDLQHAGQFAVLFAAVWWLWIGNTFYTDRFETEDASHRVFTFLQMMPVVGLAVFAHGAFDETALQFAVAYCVGRLIIIVLWWRGGHHDKEARHVTDGYVTGFTLGLLPWILSFFAPHDYLAALWTLGLLIDFAVPVLIRKRIALLPKFSHSRLAERFGLFTIMVLGESVAGTVNGLGSLEHVTALGQLMAFELWWLYFDMVPREHLKPGFLSTFGRSFVHLPLLGAIAAGGAGVLSVIGHKGELLGHEQRWLLTGSTALAFACLIVLSRVHDYNPFFGAARFRTETSLAVAAVACLLVGALGSGLGAASVLTALVVIALMPIAWGAWHWAKLASQVE